MVHRDKLPILLFLISEQETDKWLFNIVSSKNECTTDFCVMEGHMFDACWWGMTNTSAGWSNMHMGVSYLEDLDSINTF